jgi:hypothetical protein
LAAAITSASGACSFFIEQEAERMEREGLIRQYRDEQGRLCWEITEKGRRRLGEEPPPTR